MPTGSLPDPDGGAPGVSTTRRADCPHPAVFRHDRIYRSDVVVQTKIILSGDQRAASCWSALGPAKERDGRSAPCSSYAMNSGRLFLDGVARQQSPSPLHRHPQSNTHSLQNQTKGDISTLPRH